MMNWETLSGFGKNKVVKSSLVWVVITPIIAKVIFFINEEYCINIIMPFSWELFYYSAILFMIANFTYQYYCPRIIYENSSYSEFKNKGLDKLRLLEYSESKPIFESKIEVGLEKDTLKEKQVFNELWQDVLNDTLIVRRVISILYIVAVLLFAIVFIQNMKTVVMYSIQQHC